MIDMAGKQIIPAVIRYTTQLAGPFPRLEMPARRQT